MFNALLKVPMQFFILFIGVMVFVFYQFIQPPLYFKEVDLEDTVKKTAEYKSLQERHESNFTDKKETLLELSDAYDADNSIEVQRLTDKAVALNDESKILKEEVKDLITSIDPEAETKDSDYVFITFIMNYLPKGIIGLLIAVIFSAAMSSTASELNALASTTVIDFYKRLLRPKGSDQHYVVISKLTTALWGFIARQSENLIEAVNIVGSIFYGTILGIFVVAFFFKSIRGTSIFIGALIAEIFVIGLHLLNTFGVVEIGYLWYNAIGCTLTILIGWIINQVTTGPSGSKAA